MGKKFIAVLAVMAFVVGAGLSMAGDFPNKTINVLIPKAPGGGTDLTARSMIEFAKKTLKVNMIGVNKPAAAGVTAMIELANAKKDGYTLGMFVVEYTMLPHLGRCPVTYKDFTPLACAIAAPATLAVAKDAPYSTIEEFVAFAKANPGKIKVGNSGIASIWHIGAAALEETFDITLTHVPYDKGSAEGIASLVGGHIDAVVCGAGEILTQYRAGNAKVIATMNETRLDSLPDIPTFKELGYPKLVNILGWAAMVAPAGIPADVKKTLADAFYTAITDPEFKAYMKKQGTDTVAFDSEKVAEIMKSNHEYYGELLKKMKFD